MDMLAAIAQAIARSEGMDGPQNFAAAPQVRRALFAAPDRVASGPPTSSGKPILQMDALPVTINPDDYRNPLSTANPNGSLTSLWAFRQLVDPVPMFSRYYSSSGRSTEATYALIANGASVSTDNPFAVEVISQSQQALSRVQYANMDGQPGNWAPIYATPSDWYETGGDRYKTIDFDLSKAGDPDSPFATLGGGTSPSDLGLCCNGSPTLATPLDPNTRIKQITLKYLRVSLDRPWLTGALFNTNGWFLSGQPAGFCSSGNLESNDGILPLLPTSILFATDVAVDAQWAASDQKTIDDALTRGEQVALNHLVIHPANGQSSLQVLGWIASLIPLSPKSA